MRRSGEDRGSAAAVQPAAKPPHSGLDCRVMRLFALALAAALAAASGARAGTLSDSRVGFSADRTLTLDGHTYVGKVWTMPGKERHEQVIKGFQPVFILHGDSPVGDIVLAQLHTTVEF